MIVDEEVIQSMTGVAAGSPAAAVLRFAHQKAESMVRSYLRHDPSLGTHTEYLPDAGFPAGRPCDGDECEWSSDGVRAYMERGGRGSLLLLRHLPVRSVTSVHEDRSFLFGSSALVAASGWRLDLDDGGLCRSGFLIRRGGSWPREPRSIRVVYEAGWTEDDLLSGDAAAIQMGVVQTAQKFFNELIAHRSAMEKNQAGTGAVRSEKLADSEIVYDGARASSGMAVALPASVQEALAPFVNRGR